MAEPLQFTVADGHFVLQCPACQTFTMSQADGSWACRGCSGTVLAHEVTILNRHGRSPVVVRTGRQRIVRRELL